MEKHSFGFDNNSGNGDQDQTNPQMSWLLDKMEKLNFRFDVDSGTGDQNQTNPHEAAIERCVKYLVHVSKCRCADCKQYGCYKMKRVVQHAKGCKEKTNGGCPICKEFLALCCYHAKHCQKAGCSVYFCFPIRRKMRQQELQKRLEQAQTLKGCTGPPTLGAVQAAAGRQTLPLMDATSYGKDNPVVNPAAVNTGLMAPNQQMQAEMQTPMPQMMSGIPNPMLNMGNVASWANYGYPQNQQPHQNTQNLPNPQLSQHQSSQTMGEPNPIEDSEVRLSLFLKF